MMTYGKKKAVLMFVSLMGAGLCGWLPAADRPARGLLPQSAYDRIATAIGIGWIAPWAWHDVTNLMRQHNMRAPLWEAMSWDGYDRFKGPHEDIVVDVMQQFYARVTPEFVRLLNERGRPTGPLTIREWLRIEQRGGTYLFDLLRARRLDENADDLRVGKYYLFLRAPGGVIYWEQKDTIWLMYYDGGQ